MTVQRDMAIFNSCHLPFLNVPYSYFQKIKHGFSHNWLQPVAKLKRTLASVQRTLALFFNWDSLHARLNSHQEAWSYKKRSTKKITRYRKSVQKEPTIKRCLLILDLKPLRSQTKAKNSIGREFQSLAVRGKKLLTQASL